MPSTPATEQNSMLIGTNSDLVRRLLIPLAGKEDSGLKRIQPTLHQAFKRVIQEQSTLVEGVGRLWALGAKEKVLQPGEIICVKATVKLTWHQPGPLVVLEMDALLKEA